MLFSIIIIGTQKPGTTPPTLQRNDNKNIILLLSTMKNGIKDLIDHSKFYYNG